MACRFGEARFAIAPKTDRSYTLGRSTVRPVPRCKWQAPAIYGFPPFTPHPHIHIPLPYPLLRLPRPPFILLSFTSIRADITERKRAEEARGWLAAIVESSEDAIISKTLEGVITAWNRGAERTFGYSSAEAIGKPMMMLIPPERADEESDILDRIRRGESVKHFETVRMRKGGDH